MFTIIANKESPTLKVTVEESLQDQLLGARPSPPISTYLSTTMDHHQNQHSVPLTMTQTSVSMPSTPSASSLNFSVNAILNGGGYTNGRSHSTSSNCSTGSNGSNASSITGYAGKMMAHQHNNYDTSQQHNQHLASAAFLRITAAAAAAASSSPSGI